MNLRISIIKALRLCILLAGPLSAEQWVADLYPHPLLLPKEAGDARIALPAGFAAGQDLSLALRSVDVFGNVSELSNVITQRMPERAGGQAQPPMSRLVKHHSPVTGTLEPVLAAPSDFVVRMDPQSGLLLLKWTPVRDPELVGYQLLRKELPAPPIAALPADSELRNLAVWDFPNVGNDGFLPEEAWKASAHVDAIERPALALGPGLVIRDNLHYNQHGIWLNTGVSGDTDTAPGRYIGFVVSPRPGQTLALHELIVGVWIQFTDEHLQMRLEYSLDEFQTKQSVDLVPERPFSAFNLSLGSGVPVRADLSREAPLRAVRTPVAFRIFLWGGRQGIGKLATPAKQDAPDLILTGSVL